MVTAASLSDPVWNARAWAGEAHAHPGRLRSALGVALVHGLLGYALVAGLGYRAAILPDAPLKLFDVVELPPPPPPPPPQREPAPETRSHRAEGAAAPANLEARPKPIVIPPPKVRLEIARQIGAAPIAREGPDVSAGAAAQPGPGTGAGGVGAGTGAGREGNGTGAGGGIATRARHLSGRIEDEDYPRSAYRDRAGGSVTARMTVGTDGRVTNCRVTRSSGNAEIDATTCRLIERRFRYEPARDRSGRPVASDVGWQQTWWLERP